MAASTRRMTAEEVLVEVFADRDSDMSDESDGDVSEYNESISSSEDEDESGEEVE